MTGAERPLRILHVLEALEGGTARFLVDIVTHVAPAEHHVAIPVRRVGAPTDETAIENLERAGAAVHHVAMHRAPLHVANLRAVVAVRRLVRTIAPDVVHTHSSIGGVIGRLGARRADAVAYSPQGITTNRAGRIAERVLAPRTDRFVAASPSEADLALRMHLARRSTIAVIPNGIDVTSMPPPIDVRAQWAIPDGTPIVGTIARLVDQKAPDDFVAACAAIAAARADVHFVYVGDGPRRAEFEAGLARAGAQLASRFHHIESLPVAASVLASLTVFALSSRFEGAPYAPLEAMRAGVPVVLTDVVGSRDAIDDGVSGVLVPPGAPDELAAAVVALLDDPVRRRTLAAAGRRRVEERFDVRAMAVALRRVYEQMASERGRP